MMVDRVQYHLPDWNTGTDELTFEQEAAYRKLCDWYYLMNGRLKDDDHMNARRLKVSLRRYRELRNELIKAGKIGVVDGYLFNERAEKVLIKTLSLSDSAREKAEKKWANESAKSLENNASVLAGAYAGADANRKPLTVKKKTPSLPSGASPPQAKGTRLADDWQPSEQDFEFAISEGMNHAEIEQEANQFRDYWHSVSGARSVKRDWPATWRNWIRRREQFSGSGKPPGQQAKTGAMLGGIRDAAFGKANGGGDERTDRERGTGGNAGETGVARQRPGGLEPGPVGDADGGLPRRTGALPGASGGDGMPSMEAGGQAVLPDDSGVHLSDEDGHSAVDVRLIDYDDDGQTNA